MSNTRVGFEMRTEGQAVFMTRVEGGHIHPERREVYVRIGSEREGGRATSVGARSDSTDFGDSVTRGGRQSISGDGILWGSF
jgi:hypothetical protein